MCISPIRIKNPYLGLKHLAYLHDTESRYINVPCGYCKQCIALRQMDVVQRVQMEAKDSFLFFTTLTYDNDHLPHLFTSTGYDIPFADISHLQLLFKRLRNNNAFGRPFRYLAVSERGKEKSRPHFHILWFLPRYDGELYCDGLSLQDKLWHAIKDYWAVNVGTNKRPIYEPLFSYQVKYYRGKRFTNYDTHFVTPSLTTDGISSVAFYVCKYLLKANPKERRLQQAFKLNLPSDEYESSWNLVKSKSLRSTSFGLGFDGAYFYRIVDYLRICVIRSDKSLGYPCFFPPDSSGVFPLSHYYKSNPLIYDLKDHMDFVMDKDVFTCDDKSLTERLIAESKLDEIQAFVDSKDMSLEFDFLFD